MKKILSTVAGLLIVPVLGLAHEMEGGSTSGIFGLKAEYVHVVLNPLPVYGLAIGLAVLAVGLLRRNHTARTIGLIITAICSASAWLVLYYGQHAYNSLAPMLDTESKQWLDVHMARAERFIYVFYTIAVFAVAALTLPRKWPRTSLPLAALTLLLAFTGLGIGAWISRAGGQISHSEFRQEGSQQPSEPGHSHGGHPQSNEPTSGTETNEAHGPEHTKADHLDGQKQTQSADEHKHHDSAFTKPQEPAQAAPANSQAQAAAANSDHQHNLSANAAHEHPAPTTSTNPTSSQPDHAAHDHSAEQAGGTGAAHTHASPDQASSDGLRLTDTIEGTWSALHKHHASLAEAVKAGKFDDIHPQAVAIGQLTTALANIVHPDHKASVQAGAGKINKAVSDMHKSAHAEDATGVQANFKLFEEALTQLEQQMRKQ